VRVQKTDRGVSKDPPSFIEDPKHWQQRAEEARAIADQISDIRARAAMRQIADNYELVAKRAKEQMIGWRPNSK
jgi:hypothetical protein